MSRAGGVAAFFVDDFRMKILHRIFPVLAPKPSEGDWRVGHRGRDAMYYEEFADGAWRRLEIDGGMLCGRAHHVIYFVSTHFPDWAAGRRDQIVARIKSEFCPPDYEYYEQAEDGRVT
jgi:hypothetical protein